MNKELSALIASAANLSLGEHIQSTRAVKSKSSKRRRPQQVEKWSLYPELHANIAAELPQMQFHNADKVTHNTREYDTNIIGSFVCPNNSCSKPGWSSMKIPVTIRLYGRDKYNARVYHQHCKECNSLSRPTLDVDCYTDRVIYRLKKWLGYHVETPPYRGKESKGPHESDLCEGCKAGHCTEGDFDEY